jgi:hypothetical protein
VHCIKGTGFVTDTSSLTGSDVSLRSSDGSSFSVAGTGGAQFDLIAVNASVEKGDGNGDRSKNEGRGD